jgi:hypothetical protein
MPIYLNNTNIPDFVNWLEFRINRIPNLQITYRNDKKPDRINIPKIYMLPPPDDQLPGVVSAPEIYLEYPSDKLDLRYYPIEIIVSLIFPNGLFGDIKTIFIMEQVGDRVSLVIKVYRDMIDLLKPILQQMALSWPETENVINMILQIPKKHEKARTRQESIRIYDAAGKTIEEMAEKLDVSESTINRDRRKLGLTKLK